MPPLKSSVLVLNKYFMAVQVTIVKDSIIALVTGKAKVVDNEYTQYTLRQWIDFTRRADKATQRIYSGTIRSPSIAILAPQVIRFPDCEYTSPLIKTVKYSRRNIYNRDRFQCQYCGNKRSEFRAAMQKGTFKQGLLNLDHVVPRSRGGESSWTNVVTSCTWCNTDKGDNLLEELGWRLERQPSKPKWESHIGTPFYKVRKKYWERFL